jgi:hypothetical protein
MEMNPTTFKTSFILPITMAHKIITIKPTQTQYTPMFFVVVLEL